MKWQLKAVRNALIYWLPFAGAARRLKRLVQPYATAPEIDRWTVAQGVRQCELLRQHTPIQGLTILELGSGWQPTIPMLLHACGAAHIILTDEFDRMDAALVLRAAKIISDRAEDIGQRLGIDADTLRSRCMQPPNVSALGNLLAYYGMEYRRAASISAIEASSVDIVVSRAVLEHVRRPVLSGMFHNLSRILRPGGWVCHIIDNSDHYEHQDKSISRVNFLRFSESTWRWLEISDPNLPNRVRHSEYLSLLHSAGINVVQAEVEVDQSALRALRNFPIADAFRRFSLEDLATVTSYILGRKDVTLVHPFS